jgi:polyketide cyclase/dehydrase/lipid transport protein
MPGHVEYSIVTKASAQIAWDLFCDTSKWNLLPNTYGNVRWIEGEPWTPGSRLAFEVLQFGRVQVEQVITSCQPPRRVGWINHALGVTIEQWVTFDPDPGGGTRVSVWADFAGTAQLFGRTIDQLMLEFGGRWYERFREECDRLAEREAPAPVKKLA